MKYEWTQRLQEWVRIRCKSSIGLEIKNEVPKTNLLIKGSKVKWDETKAENRIRKNRMMNTTHFDNIRLGSNYFDVIYSFS